MVSLMNAILLCCFYLTLKSNVSVAQVEKPKEVKVVENQEVILEDTKQYPIVDNESQPVKDEILSDGCIAGAPATHEIGNSGLVFYSQQEYDAWWEYVMQEDRLYEIYGQWGFDGYTLAQDTCGNMLADLGLEYWSVQWKE